MLFIYWLEDHPQYAKQVDAIHSRMKPVDQDRLITGAFTFGEVLAGTYRKENAELTASISARPEKCRRGSSAIHGRAPRTTTHEFAVRSASRLPMRFISRVRPTLAPTSS